jgi:hypothetical protein
MRRQWVRDTGLFALVIGLGIFLGVHVPRYSALAATATSNPAPPAIPKEPVTYPEIPVQQPVGAPGMHPTHPGQTPSYSKDELRQYLLSTPGAFGTNKPAAVKITRLDCDTNGGDIGAILGRVNMLPSGMLVCYVEFQGTINYYGLPSQHSPRGTFLTFNTGFRVFDIKTGNLLLAGGLDHPSGSQ